MGGGVLSLVLVLCASVSLAQDDAASEKKTSSGGVPEKVSETVGQTKDKIQETAEKVDESKQAQEISAGILNPIYVLAEKLAFPAFHWVAFSLMATGVVSFALQLLLGKLVVLSKMSFSLSEVLSDLLGLCVSLIGLVLTTQAAAENSTFTTSPAAVLSASLIGLIAGFFFYRWGQAQELAAIKGRRVEKK
jgi:hypothetical protein